MSGRNAYTRASSTRGMLFPFRHLFLFLALSILIPLRIYGQEGPLYDEILVFIEIPRIGGFDIPAVIKGEELFLPIADLFDLLKIKNTPSQDIESVSGFFLAPEADYLISYTGNFVRYGGKTFDLVPGDLIKTETSLYMRSPYFGKIFGFDCVFTFRSLSVKIESKFDLPVIREIRQEEMRQNLARIRGEIKADTNIKRSYPLFRFGMADYSAVATEEIGGKTDLRLNLALGSMIAGGEATVSLNYNSFDGFREKQQRYLWRYVDNDLKAFRQVLAGKIFTQATSTLFNSVIGVQITNTPTTYRRSFGTYTLNDRTDPGWIVELYVNNVLINYVKADASGFFKFEVPLVYGNSVIQLKFFGPWGEERIREQNILIPFNFLPKNTFEYKVSAGIVEDTLLSRFSRASFNYGVARRLTVGGGMEYLSSIKSAPFMPYMNASWSIVNNLMLSGEYTHGVRSKGSLSYRLPSNIQLDLNYTYYDKDQEAIRYNYLEERKAALSLPLRIKKFSSYQRFSVYQIIFPLSQYTTGEWMISSSFLGVNTNLTTFGVFMKDQTPNLYSNLSASFRIPANFILRPQTQYGFNQNKFYSAKLGIEKYIKGKAFLNLSYEHNFNNNISMGEVGFRYNFPFAQAGASVRQTNSRTSLIEYARGSLIYDKKTKYLGGDDQPNVGRGGISVIPYIDLNANGMRDPGEPRAAGLNIRANGGRIEKNDSDTTIRILGLEPYTNCLLDLDVNSFEDISWRLPVRTISVAVDPNILKHIEIPVTIVGEASGMITLENKDESSGIGRIVVNFFKNNTKVASTLTENDGYFSYFGLIPGEYIVKLDTSQLGKLGMLSEPESRVFKIAAGFDGDFVDGLDFSLQMITTDTAVNRRVVEVKTVIKKDTSYVIVHEIVQELLTISKDSYAIQLGAFKNKSNADNLRRNLEKILGRKVEIIVEDDFFKVRINEIEDRKQVDEIIAVLQKNGITELWVISLKAKQQQMVLVEKQDSIRQITETISEQDTVIMFDERYNGKIFMSFNKDFFKIQPSEHQLIDPVMVKAIKKNLPPGKIKTKSLWTGPITRPAEPGPEPPIIKREIVKLDKVKHVLDIPSLSESHSKTFLIEPKPVDAVVMKEPTVAIQVAIFYKKSQALKAQRTISSKLKLPVEIEEQWEYFKVIIPGFYTKEETYKYYPELAGLGYPGVQIIDYGK